MYRFLRASHDGSPTRRATGLRDRHALSTTSFFRPARILVPKSPYSELTPLSDVTLAKTEHERSRNKSHVVRADDTRARGRRDDRRMHRCTPVHPLLTNFSLSLPPSLEGACCSGSVSLRRVYTILADHRRSPSVSYPSRSRVDNAVANITTINNSDDLFSRSSIPSSQSLVARLFFLVLFCCHGP